MKAPYLRILTPQTTNGVNPIMDNTGRIKYRESHMHISAKNRMEKKNAMLPQHLKHVIEVVNDDQQPPALPIKAPQPAAPAQQPAKPAKAPPPPSETQEEEDTNGQEQHEPVVEQPKKVVKKRNRKPASSKK